MRDILICICEVLPRMTIWRLSRIGESGFSSRTISRISYCFIAFSYPIFNFN
jgi:hypothetical protein